MGKKDDLTGTTTPFSPSFVRQGKLKETGPARWATTVANSATRARIEKLSADAVTGRVREEPAPRELLLEEGRKGVASSSAAAAASSWSWIAGGGARSGEDPGIVEGWWWFFPVVVMREESPLRFGTGLVTVKKPSSSGDPIPLFHFSNSNPFVISIPKKNKDIATSMPACLIDLT